MVTTAEPPRRPHNLPAQTTLLIGREQQIEAVIQRLLRPEVRLLTLLGPGGIGKTRLALAVAQRVVGQFPDGVFFVPLASLRESHLVVPVIAETLDLRETGARPLLQVLRDYLCDRQILLLLDNFETVVGAAPQIAALLVDCPGLKLLATSREALRVAAEYLFDVPPLSLPERDRRFSLGELERYEGVRLFADRAQALKSDFCLTEENAQAVREICWSLDGLPLAIQLAAARVRVFTPQALLPRMESRLKILTGGARDLPERQQTMRNAIAWSYDLLTEAEQRLFPRLSVFAEGCGLEAAEAVCQTPPDLGVEVLDGLESLVGKSLLRQEDRRGESRFVMLETVREYGQERLEESGQAEVFRRGHALYYLELVERAEAEFRGPRQAAWMERLEEEHDNLRAALGWALEGGDPEIGLRMAGLLQWFWATRGHLTEGRHWAELALTRNPQVPSKARSRALSTAANMADRQADLAAARVWLEQQLADSWELQDRLGVGHALGNLGRLARDDGDYALARALLEQCLSIARDFPEPDLGIAIAYLGDVAICQEDWSCARSCLEESLALLRELGHPYGVALTLVSLAEVALHDGDCGLARSYLEESVTKYRELKERHGVAAALERLAAVARAEGQAVCAVAIYGAAEALRDALGSPLVPDRRAVHDQRIAALRAELGEKAFAAAWSEGLEMAMEEAVAYALGTGAPRPARAPEVQTPETATWPLSAREQEVATLVAQGLTNRQIADQLVISTRTVDSHVASALRKLDLSARAQLAALVAERALAPLQRPDPQSPPPAKGPGSPTPSL